MSVRIAWADLNTKAKTEANKMKRRNKDTATFDEDEHSTIHCRYESFPEQHNAPAEKAPPVWIPVCLVFALAMIGLGFWLAQ